MAVVPAGNIGVPAPKYVMEMAIGAETTIVNVCEAVSGLYAVSRAVTVNVEPVPVGVPDSAPVVLNASPVGSVPEDTLQTSGWEPPLAVNW